MASPISCLDSVPLPDHLQVTIFDKTQISRSCETLFSFLKIYISRYGTASGPIKNFPYHPVYPFLTFLQFNHRFDLFLPKESYLLLWYLCDLYTNGIVFDRTMMFPYLTLCQYYTHSSYFSITHTTVLSSNSNSIPIKMASPGPTQSKAITSAISIRSPPNLQDQH